MFHLQAVTVQRYFRGFRVRRRLNQLRRAAIRIQSVFRGYIARCHCAKERANRNRINGYEDRLRFIQSRVSKRERDLLKLKTTHSNKVDELKSAELEHAATLIQTTFRGFQVRRKFLRHLKSRTRRPKKSTGKHNVTFDGYESEGNEVPYNQDKWNATTEESDIAEARESVIDRLGKTRTLAVSAIRERESASRLLANLTNAKRLLDDYYDAVHLEDFTDNQELKYSNQDVSMGCRALRMRTACYIEALSACGDTLDHPSDTIFGTTLLTSKQKQIARNRHLVSIRDGRMRWWEFELESSPITNTLMDLSEEDIKKSERIY
ncbi:hypothetical protein BC830DRAFT_1115232, partial [Chytriomyces sp. MP71]